MATHHSRRHWTLRLVGRLWLAIKIYFFVLGFSVFALSTFFSIVLFQKGLDLSALSGSSRDAASSKNQPEEPVAVVLTLGKKLLDTHLSHNVRSSQFEQLFSSDSSNYTLKSLRGTLKKLHEHPQVTAVLLDLKPDFSLSFQQVRRLREDIEQFTTSKPLYVYSATYSDNTYLLAASGTSRTLMPGGHVHLRGAELVTLHLRDLMSHFGVGIDIIRIGQYKATGLFDAPSNPKEKAMLYGLIDSIIDHKVTYLASVHPHADDSKARKWFQQSMFYDQLALSEGLIDGVSDLEEFKRLTLAHEPTTWAHYDDHSWSSGGDQSREKATDESAGQQDELVDDKEEDDSSEAREEGGPSDTEKTKSRSFLSRLSGSNDTDADQGPGVGLLTYSGEISFDLETGGISPETVHKTVDWMIESDDVAAVVMAIDSPGGGALASEAIWSHLNRLAEKKPLVVYLRHMAASGGYYMAVAGQEIVADPNSIVGSIGVLGIRFNIEELAEKYDLETQVYSRSEMSDLANLTRPLSAKSRQFLYDSAESFYNVFLDRVASGRKLEQQYIHNTAAQGRVWTGTQAQMIDLVDHLGSLNTAFDRAVDLARDGGADIPKKYRVLHPKIKRSPHLFECLGDPVRCLVARESRGLSSAVFRGAGYGPWTNRINIELIKRVAREPLQARLWLPSLLPSP